MLSYIKYDKFSKPFAKISGGKYKGKMAYVNEENDKGRNELKLPEGKFVPYPNPLTREVVYVAGQSGSGKSTYAAQYIYNYKKLFPANKVFVFSRLEMDQILASLGCIQIPIDEELSEMDAIRDIKNALCLFDDIDTIKDKNLKNCVYDIQNDILETGRHKNIYILVTSHLINGNDKKNSRTILNEAHKVTFFPKSGSYAINYFLKNYIGIPKKDIDEILKIKSRWITINKGYPLYIFYETGAKTI
ncbi:DNA packaging protein [Zamilon virus]|uniref:DNA packaging ATPase n=1 Tax=Zamilon virus TaxID=1411887 RepID=V6BPP1_9VIRU|nr:DNA packaging protein [Zamilon virus]AVL93344.1 DNA packaging ATPase [Zamilon virus]CDI70061.1 DNA packaging protein [Zamilon virus]